MFKVAKLGIAIAAVLALIVPAAYAGVPSTVESYYVPMATILGVPTEGAAAVTNFRVCPNNDGGSSLPNHARIKVVVNDVNGNPISGIAAADICVLFNGGTAAQGFTGVGADSVVANSTWNQSPYPLCPDVRCLSADKATDASGTTYITFAGAAESNPGVTLRNPQRKWGQNDFELPVFALGFKLQGRLETASANGSYTLRIKNMDFRGGLGAPPTEQPEAVTFDDYASVVAGTVGAPPLALQYWRDINGSGAVSFDDVAIMVTHYLHDCDSRLNP